ncbi:VOC family protein [Jonesiaceae bacterium BS-20]|uniref:VOC family protein n=1 Tax=Jonesiaceae bacterium BS-20 TaxID=3120821 RepID=A0AAU7DTD5_9MICO
MQNIVPNLWANGNATQMGEFYARTFPGASSRVTSTYPNEGLLEFQRPLAGKPLVVEVDLGGFEVMIINAGPEFAINPAISITVTFDPRAENSREEQTRLWEALSVDGQALMPLTQYPFSTLYGWVQDKFGMTWQLIELDGLQVGDEQVSAPKFIPSLLFGGAAQNKAKEAAEYYSQYLGDPMSLSLMTYPDQTGPATSNSVMYGDFELRGQMFSVMDSGAEQDYTFTEGVSLMVNCPDQTEIDRLWAVLSAVPEAEQCGWCKDKFGVSWQIVPTNINTLMERPGAFDKLMVMKKLVITEF